MLVAFNTFFETRDEAALFLLLLPWFSYATLLNAEHLAGFAGFLRYHGRTHPSEGPLMKLQQLVYVTKVAECGSITEAAQAVRFRSPLSRARFTTFEQEMNVHILTARTRAWWFRKRAKPSWAMHVRCSEQTD